jgi:hypothetical protein
VSVSALIFVIILCKQWVAEYFLLGVQIIVRLCLTGKCYDANFCCYFLCHDFFLFVPASVVVCPSVVAFIIFFGVVGGGAARVNNLFCLFLCRLRGGCL